MAQNIRLRFQCVITTDTCPGFLAGLLMCLLVESQQAVRDVMKKEPPEIKANPTYMKDPLTVLCVKVQNESVINRKQTSPKHTKQGPVQPMKISQTSPKLAKQGFIPPL